MTSLAQQLTPAVLDTVSPLAQSARVAANRGEALDAMQSHAVVEQFEQMFVKMMLKSMRSATATLGASGGLAGAGAFGGSGNNTAYLEMFDGEIAKGLVQGRGLGIGDLLREQLGLGTPARGAQAPEGALPALRTFAQARMPLADDARYRTAPRAPLQAPVAASSETAAASEGFASAREFVSALLPMARQAAQRLGVSARALLSQMALETGWGKHIPPTQDGASSNNLFGIKAGREWQGDRTTLSTLEMDDGVFRRTTAQFRVYDSPRQSLDDYVSLLERNPRYTHALATGDDVAAFARGLQDGGYATDPAYAEKIESIASGKLSALLDELGVSP